MNSESEYVKAIAVFAVLVGSYLISDVTVNALSQVALFIAWIVTTLIFLKIVGVVLESEVVESPIMVVICAIASAIVVWVMSSTILAIAKIGLTMLISYLVIKYYMPDVWDSLKEVISGE